jgi:methyltransferase
MFIVTLHAVWLAGLWVLAWDKPIEPGWLAVFILLQGLRFWVLATLGKRWTTRIIVLPGSPLVRTGPYRFLSHPNYVVVIGEIAVLPLCFGLVWYALAFSALNALVLAVRIREENSALSELRHA